MKTHLDRKRQRTSKPRHSQRASNSRSRIPQYLLGAATAGAAFAPQRSEAATVTFPDVGSIVATGSSGSPISITLPDSSLLNIQNNASGLYLSTGNIFITGSGQFVQSGGVNFAPLSAAKTYPIPDILAPSTLISTSPVMLIAPATVSGNFGAYVTSGTTPLGGFTSSFSNQYIGFKTHNGNNAYLDVSWDVGTKTLSWNGGAVETSGGALSTPSGVTPVPEATSQSGLLALLVTGAVNQLARRRMQRSKAM